MLDILARAYSALCWGLHAMIIMSVHTVSEVNRLHRLLCLFVSRDYFETRDCWCLGGYNVNPTIHCHLAFVKYLSHRQKN